MIINVDFFNLEQKVMSTLLEIKKEVTEIKKEVFEIRKSKEKNKEAQDEYLKVRIFYTLFYIYIYI